MTDKLALLEKLYCDYLEAESAVLKGKTVTFNGQSMTMAELDQIRIGREKLERQISQMKNPRQFMARAKLS